METLGKPEAEQTRPILNSDVNLSLTNLMLSRTLSLQKAVESSLLDMLGEYYPNVRSVLDILFSPHLRKLLLEDENTPQKFKLLAQALPADGLGHLFHTQLGNLGVRSLGAVVLVLAEGLPLSTQQQLVESKDIGMLLNHHLLEVVSDILAGGELIAVAEKFDDTPEFKAYLNDLQQTMHSTIIKFSEICADLAIADGLGNKQEAVGYALEKFGIEDEAELFPAQMSPSNIIWGYVEKVMDAPMRMLRTTGADESAFELIQEFVSYLAKLQGLADKDIKQIQSVLRFPVEYLLWLNMFAVIDNLHFHTEDESDQSALLIELNRFKVSALGARYTAQWELLFSGGYGRINSFAKAMRLREDTILTNYTMPMVFSTAVRQNMSIKESARVQAAELIELIKMGTRLIGLMNDGGPILLEENLTEDVIHKSVASLIALFSTGDRLVSFRDALRSGYELKIYSPLQVSQEVSASVQFNDLVQELGLYQDPLYPDKLAIPADIESFQLHKLFKELRSENSVLYGLIDLKPYRKYWGLQENDEDMIKNLAVFTQIIRKGLLDYRNWINFYTLMKDVGQGEDNLIIDYVPGSVEIEDLLINSKGQEGSTTLSEYVNLAHNNHAFKVQINILLARREFKRALAEFLKLVSANKPFHQGVVYFVLYNLFYYAIGADYDDAKNRTDEVIRLIYDEKLSWEQISSVSHTGARLVGIFRDL